MRRMTSSARIAAGVQEILRSRTVYVLTGDPGETDLLLGGGGLGLDSIALAEVLLECEQRFGVSAISLLDGEPITVGRLLAHLQGESAA
jgi:acyl carrier protein